MDALDALAERVLPEPELRAALSGGKRARPRLMEAMCAHLGVPFEPLLPAALAVELFHCSTLLHDDVIDGAALRRGLPAEQPVRDAVLYGDALAVRAVELMAREHPALLPAFLRTIAAVIEGQLMEREPIDSLDRYLAYIEKKTASVFLLCAALPCIQAKVRSEPLLRFGKEYGLAFQVANDLAKADAPSILGFMGREQAEQLLAEKVSFLRTSGVLPPGSALLGHLGARA